MERGKAEVVCLLLWCTEYYFLNPGHAAMTIKAIVWNSGIVMEKPAGLESRSPTKTLFLLLHMYVEV